MTIAAACRFPEGVALIADSRATWKGSGPPTPDDRLQKIIPLGPKIGLAYAGDIRVPESIVRHLRSGIARDPRRGYAEEVVRILPRVARRCYREYVRITRQTTPVSLIVVAVTQSGKILLFAFDAPDFIGRCPSNDFVVIGSGRGVAPYLAKHMREVDRSRQSDLKVRVDGLLPGLEDALRQIDEATVGGMLQIVLADSMGIRPYTYWQIKLDPDRPPESRQMKMTAGTWTQTNLASNEVIDLVGPRRLRLNRAVAVRFSDFSSIPLEQQTPKWHATYLLTCAHVEMGPGRAQFGGIITGMMAPRYPATLHCIVALGVWGTNGDHPVKTVLESSAANIVVADGAVTFEHFPEPQDLVVKIAADIPLGGHFKSGHRWTGQNRPKERDARAGMFVARSVMRAQAPFSPYPDSAPPSEIVAL